MDCRLKVEKPEEIQYTLTITMSAGGWEKLRDQLDKSSLSMSYPAYTMRGYINDLLSQARKIYWPKTEPVGTVD